MSKLVKKLSGFTLVELLIVVAIIGILSTIGIPTFKRMVQKAKKSEAKVALGGVYTSEAAFFSEYGAYGNNLTKIGFELEGSGTNRFYSVGFPTGGCADDAVAPTSTSTVGNQINIVFPDYYTSVSTVVARDNADNCLVGTVPADGSNFLATASGAIGPGLPADTAQANQDLWTMDEKRVLKNTQDGVK